MLRNTIQSSNLGQRNKYTSACGRTLNAPFHISDSHVYHKLSLFQSSCFLKINNFILMNIYTMWIINFFNISTFSWSACFVASKQNIFFKKQKSNVQKRGRPQTQDPRAKTLRNSRKCLFNTHFLWQSDKTPEPPTLPRRKTG